jgi:histidinol-phosphatase (PHP family)
MRTDVHAHTTFSDGSDLRSMVDAAEAAGLDGIGLTDHCILTTDAFGRHRKYDLDETYERRRERIEAARERTELKLYDAVEMSYVPHETDRIRSFLADAGFEYTLGSVHFADGYNYSSDAQYVEMSDEERREAVEVYYDAVVGLVESELFDVLAHLDLPQRLETLRSYSRPTDYDRVCAALAESRTVPELNAGRVHRSLGQPHPDPEMLSRFSDRGIGFVLGTDSHRPAEITERVPVLQELSERPEFEPLDVEHVLE